MSEHVPLDLAGRVVIVIGASSGIGEATVRLLHHAGARCVPARSASTFPTARSNPTSRGRLRGPDRPPLVFAWQVVGEVDSGREPGPS
jgi:hypothetical protein